MMKSLAKRVLKSVRNRFRRPEQNSLNPNFKTRHATISNDVLIQDQSIDLSGKIELGKCWIARQVELSVGRNQKLAIGDHVTVNAFTHIIGDVSIGNYTAIAPRCFLSSGGHSFRDQPFDLIRNQDISRAESSPNSRRIIIEEDCWIGCGSFIQQGVRIGRGAVIGAGSVVLKDISPYTIHAGIPSKKIGERLKFAPQELIRGDTPDHTPYFYEGFIQHRRDRDVLPRSDVMYASRNSKILLHSKSGKKLRIGYVHTHPKHETKISILINNEPVKSIRLRHDTIIECDVAHDCFSDHLQPYSEVLLIASAEEIGYSEPCYGIEFAELT